MRRVQLLIFGLVLYSDNSLCQPETEWMRTYGTGQRDQCNSLLQTSDGGFLLAGETQSIRQRHKDIWLMKVDANGDSLWTRSYNSDGVEGCSAIIETAEGNFALVGGGIIVTLVLIDQNGDVLWTQEYQNEERQGCESLIQTNDGGFLLGGVYKDRNPDFLLLMTDAEGNLLWSRSYGGPEEDWCYSVVQTEDGGFVASGYTLSFGSGWSDGWLLKVNADGDSLWSKTYGTIYDEKFYDMLINANGDFVFAGSQGIGGNASLEFSLLIANSEGDSLWSRTYGGFEWDICRSVLQTNEGGYALAGSTSRLGEEFNDVWLLKVSDEGDSLWSVTFGGQSAEESFSAICLEDQSFVLGGSSWTQEWADENFLLAKTTPDVEPVWCTTLPNLAIVENERLTFDLRAIDPNSDDLGIVMLPMGLPESAVLVDHGNGRGSFNWQPDSSSAGIYDPIFIVSDGEHTDSTIVRIRVTDFNSVFSSPILHPSSLILSSYPNPFNSSTTISYSLPRPGRYALDVVDIQGRLVARLADGWSDAGSYHQLWNAGQTASGTYRVVLKDNLSQRNFPVTLIK